MKRTFLPLLLILVLVVSMTGCGSGTADGIKIPFSSGVAKGQDYQKLLTDLDKAGFTNVETEVIDDLITGFTTKDGEVEQVSVDGDAKYNADARYPIDVAIVVTYHTFPEKDKSEESNSPNDKTLSKLNPPYDNDTVKGLTYTEVVEAFKTAGFTNITTEKRFEAEFWGYEADTVANIYINDSGTFNTNGYYNSDSKIRIDYYAISSSDPKSDIKLTLFYAQKALEDYAATQYPYGFKCHWVSDLINSEQQSDGSWFLKVGVTITNQNGTKQDAVAEGTISGTDENSKVEQFYVSN